MRYYTEYVYVYDQNNIPHFVQSYYGADLDGSYRSDIYLKGKSYCIHDLFFTDEVEIEGEFLPRVNEKEWRAFLLTGPSESVSTILAEAGLADVSVSKLVFIHMSSSSRFLLDFGGFIASAQGIQELEPDFLEQAVSFAAAKTGSVAEQEGIIAGWIAEQIQKDDFRG